MAVALFGATAFGLVGCARDERLTVHNLTTVAIVWNPSDTPQYVSACTTVKYIWNRGGWRPVDPSDAPSPAPTDAVPIDLPYVPPDAARPDTLLVTATGVNAFVGDTVPSNQPCAGVPPPARPTPAPASS
jgi:hypothetical protein